MSQPDGSRICFCDPLAAAGELRAGRSLLVTDGEYLDKTAHLIAAADTITPDLLHFMVSTTGSLACMAAMQSDLRQVRLPVPLQSSFALGAAFGNDGALADVNRIGADQDLRHAVVPLTIGKHGVLGRLGPAQCAVDLAKLAGLAPSAFLSKIMCEKNEPLGVAPLIALARRHRLKAFSIAELFKYRLSEETHIRRKATLPVKTRYGSFQYVGFDSDIFDPCTVLIKGDLNEFRLHPPLLRIESIHSHGAPCSSLLVYLDEGFDRALKLMSLDGSGILICLPSSWQASTEELFEVFTMPLFKDDPFSTLEDSTFRRLMAAGISAQILKSLNAERVRIVSNKPHRLVDLTKFGIDIIAHVSTESEKEVNSATCRG